MISYLKSYHFKSELVGFKTAKGNDIKVSKELVDLAKNKYLDDPQKDQLELKIDNKDESSTDAGNTYGIDEFKNIATNVQSSTKESENLISKAVNIQVISNKDSFQVGFQTAKGNKISIKEESIVSMKNKLFTEDAESQENVFFSITSKFSLKYTIIII